ncbi:MAG: tetratricopeptide repeat protein [Deltaproteobacteria bacterium]|nr:tetratricopeptide repeat protein [Deltaproteobacteria bacterium]
MGLIYLAYLAAARSEVAWLAALTGVLVGAARLGRGRWRTVLRLALAGWLVAVAGAAVWLFAAAQPRPAGQPASLAGQVRAGLLESMHYRAAAWQGGLRLWPDRPWLGQGLGHFRVFFIQVHPQIVNDPVLSLKKHPQRAHNDFVQLAAETGLGWLFLGLAVVLTLLKLGRCPPHLKGLSSGLSGLVAGWLVAALFSFPLNMPASTAHFGLALGLGWGLGQPLVPAGQGKRWAVLILAGGLALLCLGAGFLTRQTAADFYLSRAGAALRAGQEARSLELLAQADRLNVWEDYVPFMVGQAAYQAGHLDRARAAYKKVLTLFPDHPNALHNLALVDLVRGDLPRALGAVDRALEILPFEPKLYRLKWQVQTRAGEIGQAARTAETLVRRLSGQSQLGWFLLGQSLLQLGRPDRAVEALNQARNLAGLKQVPAAKIEALLRKARQEKGR